MNKIINGYIGTYTDIHSKGIYKFNFNEDTKSFSQISLACEIENPTYLSINTAKNKLFSVAKETLAKDIAGGVSSFDINEDYSLTLTKILTDSGKPPCHVSLICNEKYIIASNYHDKNATVYSLDYNQNLLDISSKAIHAGTSHVHYAMETPDNRYICVLDLGLDKICLYEFNNSVLRIKESLTIKTKKGCGPRHMVFSPCGKFAYVLCELSSEIITLKYLGAKGFQLVKYTSTLPNNYLNNNATAAIRITSDGKYLYASNRGHDSIASYKINVAGNIDLIGIYPTYGKEPRDFNITPSGNFLIIGNHKSNTITIYERLENGELTLTKKDIYSPSPVCIVFI